jgi:hypothetical protein
MMSKERLHRLYLLAALAVLLIAALSVLCACDTKHEAEASCSELFVTVSHEYPGGCRVIVDRATGVMYWESYQGKLTLLVNPDGTPRVWSEPNMPPKNCNDDILENGLLFVNSCEGPIRWSGIKTVETFSSDDNPDPSLSEKLRSFSPPESFECSFRIAYVNRRLFNRFRYPHHRGTAPIRKRLIDRLRLERWRAILQEQIKEAMAI